MIAFDELRKRQAAWRTEVLAAEGITERQAVAEARVRVSTYNEHGWGARGKFAHPKKRAEP